MRHLGRVATNIIVLVAIGSSGIVRTTQVSAATSAPSSGAYQTKGVVDWVYGPDANGPGAPKPIKGNDGDIAQNAPAVPAEMPLVDGTKSGPARRVSTGSSTSLPPNRIVSGSEQQNAQLPQTGVVTDVLQIVIQAVGIGLLLLALLVILKRVRDLKAVTTVR